MPEPADSEAAEHTRARVPAKRAPQLEAFIRYAAQNARVLISAGVLVAGVVLIILGWYGAAHTSELYAQIPYLISGGLLGLGLIIFAGILAAGALQERAVDAMRRDVAKVVADAVRGAPAFTTEPDTVAQAPTNGRHVYVLSGGRSFHEAGCPLLEGKENAKELVPARAASEGFAPCKLCGPD